MYYYITNLQGDVMQIVNGDGEVVASYQYDPYGNIISATGELAEINPLRCRGYIYDSETGLYYLQSRYYNAKVGRFINADAFTSTGQGILGNNMFAYCGNNPISRADPTGNLWWIIPIIIPLVLSGCESESSSEPYSGQANCYAYALRLENDPNTGKPFKSAPNPGDFSTSDFSHYVLYYSPREVSAAFDTWIDNDAEALGYNCFPVLDITDYVPAEGNWLIAVAYDTSPSTADYHFWRQNEDGTWSHKPGAGKIKYVDEKGNTIYDPALCARGRYEIFLGYYEIGPN